MKKLMSLMATVLASAALLGTAFGDTTTFYVVPDGEGDGSSWDSPIALDKALDSVTTNTTLLLKQGVHYVTKQRTLTTPLAIIGGFAGTETDAVPTGDRSATIISGDTGKDDVWAHVDPETGVKELALDENGATIPVIKDGAVNLPPAYTAKYDVYYPAVANGTSVKEGLGDVGGFFLSKDGATTITFTNLTFTGFGAEIVKMGSSGGTGSGQTSSALYVQNVSILGCGVGNLFYLGNWGDDITGNNVSIRFCRVSGSCALEEVAKRGIVWRDGLIESIYTGDLGGGKCFAVGLACRRKPMTVDKTIFRRIYVHTTGANGWAQPGVAVSFMYENGGNAARNCTFERCYSESANANSSTAASMPLVTDRINTFSGNTIINNRIGVTTTSDTLLQGMLVNGANSNFSMSNCIVTGNVCTVTATKAAKLVLAPVYSKTTIGNKAISKTIFWNNTMTVECPETCAATTARAALFETTGDSTTLTMNFDHCTFGGEQALEDVVYYGTYSNPKTNKISCCIFTGPAIGYSAIKSPIEGQVLVSQSIVQNANIETTVANLVLNEVTAADPMLAVDPTTGLVVPTVPVEGIEVDGKTVGAVQVTFSGEGSVLATTVNDCMGGRVTPASQLVASGASATITATPEEGYKFVSWTDADGNVVSTDATYTFEPLTTHVGLTANFASDRKTKLTFSLDGKGTFTNDTDTITIEAEPNAAFPAVPEYTIDEQWYGTGFLPTLPATVPLADSAYTMQYIPQFAVVYFDSAATNGLNDGTSWTDAATTLKKAFELATDKAAFVEIRVKKGVHYHSTTDGSIVPLNGVTVRGGFTGNGDERVTDRYATVYSGDNNKDDVWQDPDGTDGAKIMNEDGSFNDPAAGEEVAFRIPSDNTKSDNATHVFDGLSDTTGGDRGFTLDGIVFTGFGRNENWQSGTEAAVARFGDAIDVVITNCAFIANRGQASGEWAPPGGILRIASGATIVDTEFIGNRGPAVFTYQNRSTRWEGRKVKFVHSTVRNSTSVQLAGGYVNRNGRGPGLIFEYGHGIVTDSVFQDNYIEGTLDSANDSNGFATIVYFKSGTQTEFSRCKVIGNRLIKCIRGNSIVRSGSMSDILFKDNEIVGHYFSKDLNDSMGIGLVYGSGIMRNCSFIGNKATSASSVGILMDNGTALFNSTFYGNTAMATNAAGSSATLYVGANQTAIVGCTFYKNTFKTADAYLSTQSNLYCGFQNTIFWSDDEDYVSTAYWHNPAGSIFSSCTIKDLANLPFKPSFQRGNIDQSPKLNSEPTYDASGLHAYVQMVGFNPSRHSGDDVYVNAAGKPVVYLNEERNQWGELFCPIYLGSIKGTAEELGYALDTADICGDNRVPGKFNRGSIDEMIERGTLFLLK